MIYVVYALIAVVAYLLGSLNFGIILSKRFQKEDVREHGSGNAGATNMTRSYGKVWGVVTVLLDMAKVAAAILIAFAVIKAANVSDLVSQSFGENANIIIKSFAGFFCVLGHIFPCFFKFKGGKGVATCGGMVFMIDWHIALLLLMLFIMVVFVSRYVSLGSLVMAFFYPILIFVFYHSVVLTVIALVFAIIVFIAHRENIVRLVKHEENKIEFKSDDDDEEEDE